MNADYELPPRLRGESGRDLAALRDYLVRLVGALPAAGEPEALRRLVADASARAAADTTAAGKKAGRALREQARNLRALITKTADELSGSIEAIETELSSDYLARSDFGSYAETIDTRIVQTARETVESYDFRGSLETVDERLGSLAAAMTELGGEIRRGLITDPDTGEEALGIAVSQNLRFTGAVREVDGLRYEVLAPGQTLGLYTSTGWQFWINGAKQGWFDSLDGMLHVSQLAAESTLRLGDGWAFTSSGGLGLRCLG